MKASLKCNHLENDQKGMWLNQSFFNEVTDKLDYDELCIYFLMDVSHMDLLEKRERFALKERHHTRDFEWLPFERLKDAYFYPLFLKTEIYNLPEHFTIRTEIQRS